MTVQEMHIGIDLILQKINSSVISGVKPEEKDKFLNDEVYRYINQRSDFLEGSDGISFQNNIKRYEDLKALIERTTSPLNVYIRDNDSVFTFLPSICHKVLDVISNNKDLCGAAYAPPTTTDTFYYSTLRILDSEPNLYAGFIFQINSVNIFRTVDYPQFASGLTSIAQKFEMIDFILQNLRAAGYEAKYENFFDIFALECIIITSKAAFTIALTYTSSGTTYSAITRNYTKINQDPTSVSPYQGRLTKTDKIYKILPLPFGSTKYDSPIVGLEKGKVNIFHKKKFIVGSVTIDYIRIPRKISLALNQSCDLDDNAHYEIVDNVAKRLAGITTASNYQQLSIENKLKE